MCHSLHIKNADIVERYVSQWQETVASKHQVTVNNADLFMSINICTIYVWYIEICFLYN